MSDSYLNLMRAFTVRLRMLGAIGAVLGLLGLVGGVGMFGMFRIHQLSSEVIDQSMATVDQVASLRLTMAQLRRIERDMIVQYEKPDQIRQLHANWDAQTRAADERLEALGKLLPEAQRGELQQVVQSFHGYGTAMGGVIRQLEDSGYDTATVAHRMSLRAVAQMDDADQRLSRLDGLLRDAARVSNERRTQVRDETLMVFAACVVVGLLIVVPLTLLNMQGICVPIEQARRFAQAIASGDLSLRMEVSGKDEVSDLQRALEQMREGLAGMVGQLRDAGESIAAASHEIASGNQDLSGRTEQTAAQVQQTASAIGDLSEHVRHTATSSQTAHQWVEQAATSAQHGGDVVAQAVQSMHSISASSRKINDIIALIDSIAFQTNILALNAAVEAARAGEQGRGFAVVASEVRSLAQRSAEAASEIKTLISASVQAVDGGVRQVEEAGSAMKEIVEGVQKVRDVMSDISTSAEQQNVGIGDVNQSVQEIDQMTMQNASLVEQSAAAAQSMSEQAERLAQIVRQFQVESGRGTRGLLPT